MSVLLLRRSETDRYQDGWATIAVVTEGDGYLFEGPKHLGEDRTQGDQGVPDPEILRHILSVHLCKVIKQ